MTLVDCAEGLLVRLTLLSWCVALVVLVIRVVSPDFNKLSAYGGHGVVLPRGAGAGGDGDKQKKSSGAKTWWSCVMAALKTSPTGTWRIPRKHAFMFFYATGVATCTLLLLAHLSALRRVAAHTPFYPACLTAVPLLLFTLHCGIRLVETCCVQRFRPGDTVTLFAVFAGSAFYVLAAVSSAVPPAAIMPKLPSRWMLHSASIPWIVLAGAAAHVTVQAVQVMVHTTLAGLRRYSKAPTAKQQTEAQDFEESVWRYVRAGLLNRAKSEGKSDSRDVDEQYALRGSWRTYHFPYRHSPAFRLVLDPHYTCEVFLYAVNVALMVLCAAPHPSHSVDVVATQHTLWRYGCAPLAWLFVAASVGVTLFTLLNLGITSAEHRRFWNASNATRREVAKVLESLLCASSVVEKSKRLPAELVDEVSRMLREDLSEEQLPRWNVIPFVQ
ncbi:hypothetical protein ABB37_04375 [Leptomonas pyrrhocoris]|uniref:Uncharacterized protein n=1 Tax=Leptomonas pyrrhocoris TaxID=157538 RepID=A0A0M9G2N1_LEPPY|nr:hypothetical protein ABB37_04375 [Leptomonas pyrrhocoris]KPA80993.1 hypothetical protein ABB37_04375 [Leptomonas pyrrhocoris]|eukprot:XP_015659432.1 hypothetical protein ABB37_04375 [Leptomonas pyrrhocoris]